MTNTYGTEPQPVCASCACARANGIEEGLGVDYAGGTLERLNSLTTDGPIDDWPAGMNTTCYVCQRDMIHSHWELTTYETPTELTDYQPTSVTELAAISARADLARKCGTLLTAIHALEDIQLELEDITDGTEVGRCQICSQPIESCQGHGTGKGDENAIENMLWQLLDETPIIDILEGLL